MKNIPPPQKKLGPKTSIFGAKIQTAVWSAAAWKRGGILRKLKQLVQATLTSILGEIWFGGI